MERFQKEYLKTLLGIVKDIFDDINAGYAEDDDTYDIFFNDKDKGELSLQAINDQLDGVRDEYDVSEIISDLRASFSIEQHKRDDERLYYRFSDMKTSDATANFILKKADSYLSPNATLVDYDLGETENFLRKAARATYKLFQEADKVLPDLIKKVAKEKKIKLVD